MSMSGWGSYHAKVLRFMFLVSGNVSLEVKIKSLEDHPRHRKWLGSPPLISHKKAIWKGTNPT